MTTAAKEALENLEKVAELLANNGRPAFAITIREAIAALTPPTAPEVGEASLALQALDDLINAMQLYVSESEELISDRQFDESGCLAGSHATLKVLASDWTYRIRQYIRAASVQQGMKIGTYATEKGPTHVWVSFKETLSSSKEGHRWPCTFEHSRDGAIKYVRSDLATKKIPVSNKPTAEGHVWGSDGERCVKCGDKDWMNDLVCRPAPVVDELITFFIENDPSMAMSTALFTACELLLNYTITKKD